jgi:site-specific recombinase XerD
MTRGRRRKPDPTIPQHIDQAKLPRGVYWDRSGHGRWYVLDDIEGRPRKRTIATRNARLSELHAILEERAGVDRKTVGFVLERFNASDKFKQLAPRTRSDYEYQLKLAAKLPTKLGKSLAELEHARLSTPFVQRLVDAIAGQGTPTKANQLLRYLRRAFSWGVQRGHCSGNPFKGVEQAKERRRRTVPDGDLLTRVTAYAAECGALKARTEGSVAPYLWIVLELAYLCRLRPIEAITLTDAHASAEGVHTNRRKGSRDSLVRWSPRLRAAWDAAAALRERAWKRSKRPTPIRPELRMLIVSESGMPLARSSLDSAWQRFMHAAIAAGKITAEERFGLHALKHRGITDTPGTRGEKQLASGHKNERMLDTYDHSVPVVDPASKG